MKYSLVCLCNLNTPQRYGVVSAALHWLTATVVYGMLRWAYGWSRSVITTAGITGRRKYIKYWHITDDGADRAYYLAALFSAAARCVDSLPV